MNIYQKLLEVQKALVYLKLDGKGHGYDFAKGSTLLEAARPKMDEVGLLLFQEVVDYEEREVVYKTKYGDKQQTFVHIKVKFTWVNVDKPEEKIEHFSVADGFNDWDKAIGSAMTYCERYYFLKTFHIPTDKDDPDSRQEKNEPQKSKATPRKQEPKKDDTGGIGQKSASKVHPKANWIMKHAAQDVVKAYLTKNKQKDVNSCSAAQLTELMEELKKLATKKVEEEDKTPAELIDELNGKPSEFMIEVVKELKTALGLNNNQIQDITVELYKEVDLNKLTNKQLERLTDKLEKMKLAKEKKKS